MSRKKFTSSDFPSPDPPDTHPCLDLLHEMNVNDQKELLVLCPGDRIWFKSAIHGERYHNAVIKEISHGPGRRIRLDIFETPTKWSLIQRYVLKDGEKVNRMPPEGRIMMRY